MSTNFDNRVAFLANSAAVPTSFDHFVIWLHLWMKAGNRVDVQINESLVVEQNKDISIDRVGYYYWMPTEGGFDVPDGRGSLALSLLVVDDIAPISHKTHSRSAGREYGMTNVKRISRNADGELVALSNVVTPKVPRDVFNSAMNPQKVRKAYANVLKDDEFIPFQ